jgi:hypothetical protein
MYNILEITPVKRKSKLVIIKGIRGRLAILWFEDKIT